ncbi:hypothetical protein [Rhodanobacter sp. T12-5]|uniref:hypothetical protein n=1 Tax=Rhodanobacter sp. T12-5 TaxID=2024611 RepID=UPI0031B88085
MDGAQPLLGMQQERLRRHQDQRDAEIQAAQPRTDQAHVVVKRQPADEGVRCRCADQTAHDADIGEQVVMGEHHAFRVGGAARGVLQQGQFVATMRYRFGLPMRLPQRGDRQQASHAAGERADRVTMFEKGGRDQHQARTAVTQDAGLAPPVFAEFAGSERRIQRHRHATGQHDPEEGDQQIGMGRKHQGHRVAGAQAGLLQPAGRFVRCGI